MRPRLQFSLKILLLATTAFGIWLGDQANRARRQRETIAMIKTLTGGNAFCFYSYEWNEDRECLKQPGVQVEPGPQWLRNLLGIDVLDSVVAIEAQGCSLTDADLVWLLERLPAVSCLELRDNPLGNASMSKFAAMMNLKALRVSCTNVDDAGLRDIGRMKSLRTLDLCGDRVTDCGLLALSDLTELRNLYVESTEVTDHGVDELKKILPRVKKRRY